jgi:ubiquinone/menaquinone biosynthesis C-methylase UbiE
VLDACYKFTIKIGADNSEEAIKQHRQKYSTHKLIKIDADKSLPFKDNEVDFVLLCDILEHVDNPVNLLKEAVRVGKNVLLKMPIEKAFLLSIMRKVYRIEYGPGHPSGHLYCWNLSDVQNLIRQAGLTIVRSKFIPTSVDLLKRKNLLHNTAVRIVSLLNHLTTDNFLSRILIGGSFFAIVHK